MRRNKGFTIVELLVVCAIIATLATLVYVSIRNAQAQARDAKRISDMDTIGKAYQMYFQKYETYLIKESISDTIYCGSNTVGFGWFNLSNNGAYTKSISSCLISNGLLSSNVIDPSGDDSCGADCHAYMVRATANKAALLANLENPTSDQTKTWDYSIDAQVTPSTNSYKAYYGMDYSNNLIP